MADDVVVPEFVVLVLNPIIVFPLIKTGEEVELTTIPLKASAVPVPAAVILAKVLLIIEIGLELE
jgi:hypothetical protein